MTDNMKLMLFLDLEETIVKSWDNPLLINVDKVKQYIDHLGVEEVHIFSFAVYDETDQETFDSDPLFRQAIEESLGVKVGLVPTLRDMQRSYGAVHRQAYGSGRDFIDLTSKELAFSAYCRHNFEQANCILLDDKVEDMTAVYPRKMVQIDLFDIRTFWPPSPDME